MSEPLNDESSMDNELELKDIYGALAHEVRREILRFLGAYSHRGVSFSELNSDLQLKPGTFYYHLDKMKGLVEQLPDKSYQLTELGKKAHIILLESERLVLDPRSEGDGPSTVLTSGLDEAISTSFQHSHHPLFSLLERAYLQWTPTVKTMVQVFVILIFQSVIASISGLGVIPLYFDAILYFDPTITFIQVVVTSVVIWLLLEVGVMMYTRRQTNLFRMRKLSKELLILIPITQLPLYLYPILVIVSEVLLIPLASDRVMVSIFLLALQLFTSLNMAMAVYVTKHLPYDKCFLLSLGVLYLASLIAWTIAQS